MNPIRARFLKPTLEPLEDRCMPSAGFLDPSFDGDGVVTTQVAQPFGGGWASGVAIYAPGTANAGKIVAVGGGADSHGNDDIGLVRYNPNGSLDPTFGAGGIVNQSLSGVGASASAVALVGDKILVSGSAYTKGGSSVSFALARFNADGSLDQSFGSKGSVQTSFGKYSAEPKAMAVQAGGKIVVSGMVGVTGPKSFSIEFAVARYTPNGALDTTFGNSGMKIIDVGESLENENPPAGTQSLVLSGDRIDLIGYGHSSLKVYVVQLTATGQPDPIFGVGGVVNLGPGFQPSLTVQPDGKLVAASYSDAGSPPGIHVTRLLANGSPDTGFATGGTATVSWLTTGWGYHSTAVKVDPLERFVIGGWYGIGGPDSEFMVIRLTSSGALDSTFGVGGIGTSGNLVTLILDRPWVAMTLQPDGKTVLVGPTQDGKFAVARFDGDSALLAVSVPPHAVSTSITSDQAQPLLAEAEARWQAAGVDTSILGAIDIRIVNLGGTTLGFASGHTIWLDDNAAGWGWYVDPMPWDDSEFTRPGNQGEQNRMDLLTVLEHEVGHLLGYEHKQDGVMQETLSPGKRLTLPGIAVNESWWLAALADLAKRRDPSGWGL